MDKFDWKLLVIDELSKYNEKYDTLDILAVDDNSKKFIVNYKITRGDWCTSFGKFDFKKSEIDKLLRNSKINLILK